MAEKSLGGISWYVDADTSPAVKSIKEFDRVVAGAEGKLAQMDDATKKATIEQAKLEQKTNMLTAALRKQGNVIASNGVVLDKYGQVNERATRTLSRLNAEQIKLTKTASAVNKGVAGIGRSAGQAGIQFQQFIGQIQGGQSPMLALSQQSADLGFVLGAPLLGAVVGITASLAGMLLPELMSSKNALELVEAAVERVQAAMTLSVDGIADYSKEMKVLKNISEELLKVKLAGLIADQKDAMKLATKGLEDALDDARGSFTTWQGFVKDVFGSTSKEAQDAMSDLSSATDMIKFGATEERVLALEAALTKATEAGINNTKEGREIAMQMVELISKFKIGEITVKQFEKALAKTDEVTSSSAKSLDQYTKLAESLSTRVFKLRSESLAREKALTLEKAAQNGVSESVRNSIAASFDKMIANAKEAESEREKAKAVREAAKAQRKADKEISAQDKRRRESAKRVKRIGEGVGFAKDVLDRGTGETPEVAQFREEQEKLDDLRRHGLISEQLYQDALTQSRRDGEMARQQITAAALGSFSNSFDQLASVFKNAEGEQSAAFKTMFALSKGFAVAQAGLNLSKAISDALAWGGMTLPEKFASIAAVTAAGAQVATSIASATYSGREHGGSVMAGQTYEVGEKNKPELLMIPGNNGKVLSNSEMKSMMGGGGGGGAPIINVHNYSGSNVDTRTRQDSLTRQDVIDIIIGQTGNTNSRTMRNISQNTTANNIASPRR